jgi:hypothetical protein
MLATGVPRDCRELAFAWVFDISHGFFSFAQYRSIIALITLVASASAFAPSPAFGARQSMKVFGGKYEDQLWDNAAKKDVYASWDPNAPRSEMNFNPFETWEGNSPDASGYYPGEVCIFCPIR